MTGCDTTVPCDSSSFWAHVSPLHFYTVLSTSFLLLAAGHKPVIDWLIDGKLCSVSVSYQIPRQWESETPRHKTHKAGQRHVQNNDSDWLIVATMTTAVKVYDAPERVK